MDETFFDQLIDLALDIGDFDWVKQLQKQKYKHIVEQSQQEHAVDTNYDIEDIESIETFEGVALEDIETRLAIEEEDGLRNLNLESNYDLHYGNVVAILQNSAMEGETVQYYYLEEKYIYYFIGYMRGVDYILEELENNVNNLLDTDKGTKKWWQFWKKK